MTAPATPTPLDVLEDATWRYYDLGDDTGQSDGADRVTRALIDTALAWEAATHAEASRDALVALVGAVRQYRAWAPSPDAARDGGGE